jgi:type IV pilus assembly protein PilF
MLKFCLAIFFCLSTLISCVTRVVNNDGTVQNTPVDKTKLSNIYVDLAIEYQKHNAPQVALERVNSAIDTDSDNARAYMVRGTINQSLNQNKAAEQDFKQALKLKENYSEADVNYAIFLCNQERYNEANIYFSKALMNPLYYTPEIAYYHRGECYIKAGNMDAANNDYLQALAYRNPPQKIYIALAELQYNKKNYELANFYINKYKLPETPEILLLHIQILQALINSRPSPTKLQEYTSYRNNLVKLLLSNYGNTVEAQQYILKNGTATTNTSTNPINKPKPTIIPIIPNNAVQAKPNNIHAEATTKRRYVIVSKDDTLYSIAHKYSVSVNQLKAINDLQGEIVKLGSKVYLDPK